MEGPRGALNSARSGMTSTRTIFKRSAGHRPFVGVPVGRVEVAVWLQALEFVAVAVDRVRHEKPHMRDIVVDERRCLLVDLRPRGLIRRGTALHEQAIDLLVAIAGVV